MVFKFQLQALMQYRLHLFKNAQIALANAQRNYQQAHAERDELKRQISQQKQIWKEQQACGIQVANHLAFRNYLGSLEQHLQNLDGQINELLRDLEQARKMLLEREKEVGMLESLREKAQQDYRHSTLKREQKQLDEIVIFSNHQDKKA